MAWCKLPTWMMTGTTTAETRRFTGHHPGMRDHSIAGQRERTHVQDVEARNDGDGMARRLCARATASGETCSRCMALDSWPDVPRVRTHDHGCAPHATGRATAHARMAQLALTIVSSVVWRFDSQLVAAPLLEALRPGPDLLNTGRGSPTDHDQYGRRMPEFGDMLIGQGEARAACRLDQQAMISQKTLTGGQGTLV